VAVEKFEVVVYRDSGGNVQVWTGPNADWAEHVTEHDIEEDHVEDNFTVVGEVAPTSKLKWTKEKG